MKLVVIGGTGARGEIHFQEWLGQPVLQPTR